MIDLERAHWLNVTDNPQWKPNHIADPNISTAETVDAIVSAFPPNVTNVLEIGCGYGRLLTELAAVYPDVILSGTDINSTTLREVRGAKTYCTDTLAWLPAQDAIYSVAVFQHLPDPQKRVYIFEAYELLNPGGVLRVQFIPGERDLFLDHWVQPQTMAYWFAAAGFKDLEFQHGLAHEQWTWITGKKQ